MHISHLGKRAPKVAGMPTFATQHHFPAAMSYVSEVLDPALSGDLGESYWNPDRQRWGEST